MREYASEVGVLAAAGLTCAACRRGQPSRTFASMLLGSGMVSPSEGPFTGDSPLPERPEGATRGRRLAGRLAVRRSVGEVRTKGAGSLRCVVRCR